MIRSITSLILFSLLSISAVAQSWQEGYFYDKRGAKNTGFIRQNPPGKGPIKDEAFIEYKQYEKDPVQKLSASDLRSYVAGRDSFIVAASLTDDWAKEQLDFIRVAVDAPIKLYMARVGNISSRKRGVSIDPAISTGIGTGGYGGGVGGGVSINLGRGGSGGTRIAYLYGESAARMQPLTDKNFVDVMTEIMGDEPEVVDQIQNKKFTLANIEQAITYYNALQASRKK